MRGFNEENNRKLKELLSTLDSEVSTLSKTHAEQAESIAGFAERSKQEAARSARNPKLLNHSLAGLSFSVEEFESSHPKLVEVVNSISNLLSNAGI